MESKYGPLISTAYEGFNARDINRVFSVMSPQVYWPKAFEGGHVTGQERVRAYWLRQWSEINPVVLPVTVSDRADGRVEVIVDQLVKDLEGNILFDGKTTHVYTIAEGLIQRMDIES